MKTAKIISIVCWLVTALILIGLAVWFLSGNLFGFRTGFKINLPAFRIGNFESLTGPFNAVGTFEAPAADVRSLDIDWVAGSVKVTPYDGDTVKITEYAQRALSDNEKFVCGVSGGTLDIMYCTPGWNITITKRLEILVPGALADKLDVLDVVATSAEVTINDFSVNTLNVKEVSGTADLSGISAIDTNVSSVSGTIIIENMTAAKLKASSVSGDIRLNGVTADTLISDSTSGSQKLQGTFKDVEAGSVSGEISVASGNDPDRMYCHSTSGGITVTIPGNTDPTVSYSAVSGRFNSDIPLRTGDSGDYKFKTVSGDISLKAA